MSTELLKETITLEQVAIRFNIPISNYNGSGSCPVCNSSKAFRVWGNKIFKCYRCDFKGDIFSLLTKSGRVSDFKEAYKLIAELAGHQTYSSANYFSRLGSARKAFDAYLKVAKDNPEIVEEYFHSRGWDADLIAKYPVGLSLAPNQLKQSGLSRGELEDLNIMVGENELYYNHLIFPMYSCQGNVIHFIGRLLEDKEGVKRWICSRSNGCNSVDRYFYNSSALYNPSHTDYLFLCEGVSDAYSLLHLEDNVIGQVGINAKLCMEYEAFSKFKRIVAVFDNDSYALGSNKAGEYKSWSQMVPQLVDLITMAGVPIYYLSVPQRAGVKDINDYLMYIDYDRDQFINYVSSHVRPLTDLCVEMYKDNIKNHDYIFRCIAAMPKSGSLWFEYLKKQYGSLESYLIEAHR